MKLTIADKAGEDDLTAGAGSTIALIGGLIDNQGQITVSNVDIQNAGTNPAMGTITGNAPVYSGANTTLSYEAAASATAGGEFPATNGPQTLYVRLIGLTLSGSRTVKNVDLDSSILTTGGANTLTIPADGTISVTTGYVIGNLNKQFSTSNNARPERTNLDCTGITAFTYPVGTANGYSPVDVCVSSLNADGDGLTVAAVQGVQPQILQPDYALKRYWSITENGSVTADLTFHYLAGDVGTANESGFMGAKYESGTFTRPLGTIDTNAHTLSVEGVAEFSDWTAGEEAAFHAPLPVVTISSVSPSSVAEDGAASMVFTFTRTGDTSDALDVNFGVTGTADIFDYTASPSTTVHFDAGSNTATVTVTPFSDTTVENDETVTVTISTGSDYSSGDPNSATGTIVNDDQPPPPTFSISGHVSFGASPLEGVTITPSNGAGCGGPTSTDSSGNYSLTGIPQGNLCMITASLPGYQFSPSAYNGIGADAPNEDFIASAETITTITNAAALANNTAYGENYTIEFTVTTGASGNIGGTVDVTVNDNPYCTDVTLDMNASGSCTVTNPITGIYSIVAHYKGSAPYLASDSTQVDHTVDPIGTDLVVNTTSDHAPDGFCVSLASGDCTLREAILASNIDPDETSITFDIPTADSGYDAGAGTWTIQPTSALPDITERASINGGGTPNGQDDADDASIVIQIDGTSAGDGANGLTVKAVSEVSGLAIYNFGGNGIALMPGSGGTDPFTDPGSEVIGNFIGTDAAGLTDKGNGGAGVYVDGSSYNMIGCTSVEERNLIVGNEGSGVFVTNSSSHNLIGANFIGVGRDGSTSIGNDGSGVEIGLPPRVRPNSKPEDIEPPPVTPLPTSQDNLIGAEVSILIGNTRPTSLARAPKHPHKRRAAKAESTNSLIEGANLIANNGGNGITISDGNAINNRIQENSIHDNTFLGIDLGPAGPTANDTGDGDTGANNLQNFPVIAKADPSTQTITGSLEEDPNAGPYTLELFKNASCDGSGYGEGATSIYIGPLDNTATQRAERTLSSQPINVVLQSGTFAATDSITATVTDGNGNTSEFSPCQADLTIKKTASADPVNIGADLTYTIVVKNDGAALATGVVMTDVLPASTVFRSATTSQGSLVTPPVDSTGVVTANIGTLALSASATVTITVRGTQSASVTNSASATSNEFELNPSDNTDSVTVQVQSQPGSVAFAADTGSGSESVTAPVINVQRTGGSFGAASVQYAVTGGSATGGGADYTLASGTLNWNDGDAADKAIPLVINNDTLDELDQTVEITLSNAAGASLGTPAVFTYTINDDDASPAFSVDDVTHSEGNTDPSVFVFTVTKTGATELQTSVAYNLNNVTATGGTCGGANVDYQGPSGNFVFDPNETSKTIVVISCADTAIEPDETFTVDLSSPTNASISDAQGIGTILNDDCAPLPFAPVSWFSAEGNTNDNTGANAGTWVGTPSYATGKVGQAFDISGSKMVTASGTGSLNITGDQMTMAGWIYPRTNDSGTFYFGRSAFSDHPYVLYNNGGKVYVIVSSGGVDNQEFDTGFTPPVNTWTHLTMTYNGSSGTGLKVYANGVEIFSNSGPSGNLRSSTLPFAIGNRATDPSASSFNGLIDEVEVFDQELSTAQVSALASAVGAGQCSAFTVDDHIFSGFDTRPEAAGDEGFTVTLIGPATQTASVNYKTQDGTAKAGQDFTGISAGSLTFAPGERSKFVPIHILDDNVQENDEIFSLLIARPAGATILKSLGIGTIKSGDPAPSFSISDVSVVEGNSGTSTATFTITKTGATTLGSGVQVTTHDGTATEADNDYLGGSQFISFNAADTSKTFSVTVKGDTALEPDETFGVTLTNSFNANIVKSEGVGTILNDECTTMPGGMTSWIDGSGTAPNANDIVGPNNGTLQGAASFATGKVGQAFSLDGTSGYVTFPDSPANSPTSAITVDAWVNPTAVDGLREIAGKYDSSTNQIAWEFGIRNGKLELSVQQGGLLSSPYRYASSNTAVIPTGVYTHVAASYDQASQEIHLYVNGSEVASSLDPGSSAITGINDSSAPLLVGAIHDISGFSSFFGGQIDEVEIFNRALNGSEIAAIASASGGGKCHTSTIQFSAADYPTSESAGSPTVTVTRVGAHDTAASVNVDITDGTATSSDYTATTPVPLIFNPGDVSKTVSGISITPDNTYENNETINLALSGLTGTGTTLGSQTASTVTITNDDNAPTLAIDDVTFTSANSRPEGAAGGFQVTLTGATEVYPVTVHYKSADNTATAPSDYLAVEGDLTFGVGETSKPIPVTIVGDNVEEPTETFFVNLSNPVNAAFGDNQGVGTIPNDDVAVASIGDATDFEGNAGTKTFSFPVTLTKPVSTDTRIYYSTSDGSATDANNDYDGVTDGSILIPAGQQSGNISITVNGDTTYEPDETFDVTISLFTVCATNCKPAPDVDLGDSVATGTIKNDDCLTDPVVTNFNDTGDGSLRWAVGAACPGSTIRFNFGAGQPDNALMPPPQVVLQSEIAIGIDLTIQGPGAQLLTLSGGTTNRLFNVTAGNVNINAVTMAAGAADFGAAINVAGGTLKLDGTRVTGNTATNAAGGINIAGGTGHTFVNSTFDGNSAPNCGAIRTDSGAPLTIINSTISGNSATAGSGGAVCAGGNVTLTNVTIAGNSATNSGGGILVNSNTATLKNSIVATNTGQNPDVDAGAGTVASQGYNLIGKNTGAATAFPAGKPNANNDVVGSSASPVDPLVGPLQPNGGQTPTRALLQGSPAIDKGSAVVGMTTDQRGSARPIDFSAINNATGGNGSDIGAFEVQQPTAGDVSISGRVRTADGRGITNATVTVSGGALIAPLIVTTGRSGSYTVGGLESGKTYVVTVGSRRFTFTQPSRIVTLGDNAVDVDFVADQ